MSDENATQNAGVRAAFRRFAALVWKEFLELIRDRSSILMGVVLPLMLILIIGYGMSLDVENVPTAVVLEDTSPTARSMVSFTQGSKYFSPVFVHAMPEAEEMLKNHEVSAILRVPHEFTERLAKGDASVQLILNGGDATTAMSAQSYVQGAVLAWVATRAAAAGTGQATVVSRVWFNDANTSTWFFVPGILMMVLTISGVFLTAMVMAREWERGTFESLFVTPVRIYELILAKVVPYFVIGMGGMLLCLLAGRVLFDLPMRGSMLLILGESMLYLVIALALGLVISSLTKNQLLACQLSLLISFLPTIMLSGFLFDLHSEPIGIRAVSHVLPMTYFLELMKSLLLAGNYWPLIAKNTALLMGYAVLFLCIAYHLTKKKVEG